MSYDNTLKKDFESLQSELDEVNISIQRDIALSGKGPRDCSLEQKVAMSTEAFSTGCVIRGLQLLGEKLDTAVAVLRDIEAGHAESGDEIDNAMADKFEYAHPTPPTVEARKDYVAAIVGVLDNRLAEITAVHNPHAKDGGIVSRQVYALVDFLVQAGVVSPQSPV